MPDKIPRPRGRPRIADVAAMTGVSTAAVSQILNGKGRASDATRELVFATARQIGYDANPVARSLRTGRTAVLGIFFRPVDAIPGSLMGTEYHVRVAGSAAARALSLGYALLHTPSPLAPGALAYPMDGCVVVGPVAGDEVVSFMVGRGTPVVCVDPVPDQPDLTAYVGRDEAPPIHSLLEHLRAQGARSFGLLSVSDDIAWKRGFVEVFNDWCAAASLPGQVQELPGDAGDQGAATAIDALVARQALPDALICATSRFAIGAARAARGHGLRIPQDLMLAALSDSELARSHDPQITALDLHGDLLGQRAVTRLVEVITGQPPSVTDRVAPTLKLRASTQRRATAPDRHRS